MYIGVANDSYRYIPGPGRSSSSRNEISRLVFKRFTLSRLWFEIVLIDNFPNGAAITGPSAEASPIVYLTDTKRPLRCTSKVLLYQVRTVLLYILISRQPSVSSMQSAIATFHRKLVPAFGPQALPRCQIQLVYGWIRTACAVYMQYSSPLE